MTGATPVLAARGVSAGYHGRAVVRGVSIEVLPGELLAVVGPNGAGKSTVLKVLGGLLNPYSGAVELEGRPLGGFDRRAVARRIASLGQESSTAFAFTVMEMVLMGRAPHLGALRLEGARDIGIAREALEHFDLTRLASRAINELSGGERRRVFLARVLAQEPTIALLDEPTAFLDLKHVAEIFARLAQVRAGRRMAVIATLHDLNAAAQYADRILLLKDGVTVACGNPEEVLTRENLRLVYETEIYVGRNPANGKLAILPAGR